ncbi:cupin domain-containing protein [Gordonia sp. NPDC003425]
MPLIAKPNTFEMHGAVFESFVSPSRGSSELCGWRTELRPGQIGAEHCIDAEEILLVLSGRPRVVLDGAQYEVAAGDVLFAAAGTSVRVDNPHATPARMWVSAVAGLTATSSTGERICPPWTH